MRNPNNVKTTLTVTREDWEILRGFLNLPDADAPHSLRAGMMIYELMAMAKEHSAENQSEELDEPVTEAEPEPVVENDPPGYHPASEKSSKPTPLSVFSRLAR